MKRSASFVGPSFLMAVGSIVMLLLGLRLLMLVLGFFMLSRLMLDRLSMLCDSSSSSPCCCVGLGC